MSGKKQRTSDNDDAGKEEGTSSGEPEGSKLGAVGVPGGNGNNPKQRAVNRAPRDEHSRRRLDAIKILKENNNTNPYPHRFNGDLMELSEFEDRYRYPEISVAGRVRSKELLQGGNILYKIERKGVTVSIKANLASHDSRIHGNQNFAELHGNIDLGDIVGVRGEPFQDPTGPYILALEMKLLAPCLQKLPDDELQGIERYSERYLDLILNQHVRENFKKRARTIAYLRKYLDDMGFLEVETPMLHETSGAGASAKAYRTFCNQVDKDLFLRVAPELHLKMLIVGGMDRIYEIGRNFRNDALDESHNPEYTACEFYMAYADYNKLMDMTEDLISKLVRQVTGQDFVPVQGSDGHINCNPPFRRLEMIPALEVKTGKQFPAASELSANEGLERLYQICIDLGVDYDDCKTAAHVLKKLVKRYLIETCIQPTFIVDYPEIMSPLAKSHRDPNKEGLTERFELFINKKKICNAYTELNDSEVQCERFDQQEKAREAHKDEEAHRFDEKFCKALEYGLPPTAGWGMGIDTMVMLLTGSNDIKDVILFPTVAPDVQRTGQNAQAAGNAQ